MASRYVIVCNYGTHDGIMVQINNKVLTNDKTFMIVKNYVKGFTKAYTLRSNIVNGHCSLKKLAAKFDKI